MSKAQCQLNHSRNLSTSYRIDNYYYDIERSKATAKQVKFYRSLWYKFKENNIDINEELDKRGVRHSLIQNPSGRIEFSRAIDVMTQILKEKGVYEYKNDKQGKFTNTYNVTVDNGGQITRSWEKIEYDDRGTESRSGEAGVQACEDT